MLTMYQSLYLDASCILLEKEKKDENVEEPYFAIEAHEGAYKHKLSDDASSSKMPSQPIRALEKLDQVLTFIPYYYRSNRGGNGQMRVGLKLAQEWMIHREASENLKYQISMNLVNVAYGQGLIKDYEQNNSVFVFS